jgi:hypothetical protein
MHVLGETLVRIEGVNRACTERQIEQKDAQDDRKDFAGPVKARNYLPRVGSRKTSSIMAPGPLRLKRAISISEQWSRNEYLGFAVDLVELTHEADHLE